MKLVLSLVFLFTSLSFAQEQAFEADRPLTADEERQAKNYIHQGVADTTYQEICEGEDQCFSDRAWTDGPMSTVEGMMPIVSQMYGMFSGTMGGKLTANVTENGREVLVGADGREFTPTADGGYATADGSRVEADSPDIQNAENKTEERMDFCGMIPTATETFATAYQQMQNETTQQNYENAPPEARQRASFMALASMHRHRAETAKYQWIGWGSTAGCYAGLAAATSVVMDLKTIGKMTAAGVIAAFYAKKEKEHNKRAKWLKQQADLLPGAGDCNPHTDTTCFCAEETSYGADPANFMKYCVAQALRRENNQPGFPCITKEGKPDPECSCKKRNTCFKANMLEGALAVGLNPAQMQDPMAGIEHLSTGYGSGNLGPITARNLARAKRELGKVKTREKINLGGNKKAQEIAKELLKHGLPKALAASVAKRAASSNAVTPPGASGVTAPFMPKNSSGTGMRVGKGKNRMKSGNSIRSKSSDSTAPGNPFARRKTPAGTTGTEIMDFAQEAAQAAEISKDKGRPIFEIITYRYQMRAWKEFEEAMQENMVQEDLK